MSRRAVETGWQSTFQVSPSSALYDVANDPLGNVVITFISLFPVVEVAESRRGWSSRRVFLPGGIDPGFRGFRVAADGASVALVYFAHPNGPFTGQVRAHVFDWQGTESFAVLGPVSTDSPGALVAAERGYAVLFATHELYIVIHDGSAWGSRMSVDSRGAKAGAMASDGTRFGAVWINFDDEVRAQVYEGASVVQTLAIGAVSEYKFESEPVIAAAGAQWMVVWVDRARVMAAAFDSSGARTPVELGSGADVVRSLTIANRRNGFDVVWIEEAPVGEVIRRQRFEADEWFAMPAIAERGSFSDVSLAVDPAGALAAIWVDAGQTWAQLSLPD